jgi:two-component system response regulator
MTKPKLREQAMNLVATDILLVEESPNHADLTIHDLRREHHIHIAKDGEEALDFLFCRGLFIDRSFACPPKLVLLDLKLPRVDGIEVLRQVKNDSRTKTIPVVVMTSSSEEHELFLSYDLGANSVIQKPIDSEIFRQKMRTLGLYWMVINQLPSLPEVGNEARRPK